MSFPALMKAMILIMIASHHIIALPALPKVDRSSEQPTLAEQMRSWQWHLAMASYHSVRHSVGTCPSVIVASPKLNPHIIELLRSFFSHASRLWLPGAGMTAAPSAPDADFDLFAVVLTLYLGDHIIDPGSRRLAIAATASAFN